MNALLVIKQIRSTDANGYANAGSLMPIAFEK